MSIILKKGELLYCTSCFKVVAEITQNVLLGDQFDFKAFKSFIPDKPFIYAEKTLCPLCNEEIIEHKNYGKSTQVVYVYLRSVDELLVNTLH